MSSFVRPMRAVFHLLLVLPTLSLASSAPLSAQEVQGRRGSLTLGAVLQPQYSVTSVEGVADDVFFRRARVRADADVTTALGGRIEAELSDGTAELVDAYVRLDLGPARVVVGQKKLPFDPFFIASMSDLKIIERDGRIEGLDDCPGVGRICSYGQLTAGLGYAGRDRGVWLEGGDGPLSWSASLTNGTGDNAPDDNDAKSLSGRLGFEVAPGVLLSGSAALRDRPGADGDTERDGAWEVDLEVGEFGRGLHLQAALAGGANHEFADPGTGETPSFLAGQGTVTWHTPVEAGPFVGVEPLLRVSLADARTDIAETAGLLLTPGLSLYLAERNFLTANLDLYKGLDDDWTSSLKLQAFLYF